MFISALQRRVATAGARPLFTHYDGETRIELSAVTFANWVDKTANLLESLDVEPGELVSVELASTHPGHWVSAVWISACWQRGCGVTPTHNSDAALLVAGPGVQARGQTVACSLDPLGRGFETLPTGCLDYAEVFSEPDVHLAVDPTPTDAAWPGVEFQQLGEVPPRSAALLIVDPEPGFETVADLLIAPVLGGGSTIVATNCTPDQLAGIRRQEKL